MYKTNSGKVLLLCFTTYLTVYILRVNLSSAIPQMENQMGLSNAMLGLMGSAFFVTYAFGQLINGFIADSVSPFRFVLLGLVGTISANLLIFFCSDFSAIVLFWAANGYFQSIFWASLTRILSLFFTPEKHSLVATVMSSSMVGGFLVSWVVMGKALGGRKWNLFFLVPALIGCIMLAVWAAASQKAKNVPLPAKKASASVFRRNFRLIVQKKIYLYMFVCLCLGFVKESISVWGPTLVARSLGIRAEDSAFVLLFIPFANLCGMFLAKLLIDRFHGNETKVLVLLFACMAAGNLILYRSRDGLVITTVLLLAEISAMSYGCNSILLSFVPLSFTECGIVSTTVGMFDFSSYRGASLSSAVIGIILVYGKWKSAALLWAVLAVTALVLCIYIRKKTNQAGEKI